MTALAEKIGFLCPKSKKVQNGNQILSCNRYRSVGGRHILGSLCDGKIVLDEVYRFENAMDEDQGTLFWDVDRLFDEIVTGLAKCKQIGKIPVSVGIDTWGVDFVLLDKNDNILESMRRYIPPMVYREGFRK